MVSPVFTACSKKPCLTGQVQLPDQGAVVATDQGDALWLLLTSPETKKGRRTEGRQGWRHVWLKKPPNFKKKKQQQTTPLAWSTADAALYFLYAAFYHNFRGDSTSPAGTETPPSLRKHLLLLLLFSSRARFQIKC